VAGGVAPGSNGWVSRPEIFAYDPNTKEWRTVGTLIHPVRGPGMVALGERIYVVGGSDEHARLQIIDPSTGKVEAGAPLPAPMTRATATVLNGKLHAIGVVASAGEDPSCDFGTIAHLVFDPAAGAWSRRANPPWTACIFSGAVTVGGAIYFVGGSGQGQVAAYDAETDSWTTYEAPRSPYNAAAVALDGKLYIIAGEDYETCCSTGPVGAVNRFDPPTKVWNKVRPMSTARAGLGAAVVGSSIYIIGGWSPGPTTTIHSVNERLSLEWRWGAKE
jgi:N-acetylneuraminic acid mutarotase